MVEDARIIDLGPRDVPPAIQALVDNQWALMEAMGLDSLFVSTAAGLSDQLAIDGRNLIFRNGEWRGFDVEYRRPADEDE